MTDLGLTPLTLGEVGSSHLRLICRGEIDADDMPASERQCGSISRVSVARLVEQYGRDTFIRDLRDRFKCERCGTKQPAIFRD